MNLGEYRCACGEIIYQDRAHIIDLGYVNCDFRGRPLDACPGCGVELEGPTLEDLLEAEREMGEEFAGMVKCGGVVYDGERDGD